MTTYPLTLGATALVLSVGDESLTLNLGASITPALTSSASVLAALASAATAVSINDQLLTDVSDPVSAQDAATKAYVDDAVSDVSSALEPRIIALIDDITLTAGDRGTTYVASDAVIVTLPPSVDLDAIAPLKWSTHVRVVADVATRVQSQGADVIRYYGQATAAAGYLEIADRDAVLDVEYIGGGIFLVVSALREWSFGP